MSDVSDVSDVRSEMVQEIAAYIRDMSVELAAMARAAQCDTLHSVLEMAEMEANRLMEVEPPELCPARRGTGAQSGDAV